MESNGLRDEECIKVEENEVNFHTTTKRGQILINITMVIALVERPETT
jgi:hypothetical protein